MNATWLCPFSGTLTAKGRVIAVIWRTLEARVVLIIVYGVMTLADARLRSLIGHMSPASSLVLWGGPTISWVGLPAITFSATPQSRKRRSKFSLPPA